MTDDGELLRRYRDEHSEDAFTELVQRHVNLVYFAALRRVGGDAHLADDVAQKVFTDLARKASSLKNRPVLAGWLYTSTRFAAAQTVRTEQRRRTHEQEAHTMHEILTTPEPDWDRLRPLIDEAMDELNDREREAVLLRFFENRPLAEVGEKFSLSPDAARMRVDRALEKLRSLLAKRGIISTSAALAAAFAAQSAVAAPAGLVAKIVTGTLSQVGTATTATLALWKILTGVAIVGVGVGVVVHETKQSDPPSASVNVQSEASLAAEPAAIVVPQKNVLEAARTASSPNKTRRTTEDFGWPQVGLFAGDTTEKTGRTIKEFRTKLRTDAEFRETVLAQAKGNLDLFYGHLFKTLQLSAAELDRFKNLLVDKAQLKIETVEAQNAVGFPVRENRDLLHESLDQVQEKVDAEIKTLLGESRNLQYLQYREDLVQWTAVNEITERLQTTATPLTDEQAAKLVVLLRSSLLRVRYPFTFDLAYVSGLFSGHIGVALTERTFRQAGEFLSAPQIEVLRQLQRPRKLSR